MKQEKTVFENPEEAMLQPLRGSFIGWHELCAASGKALRRHTLPTNNPACLYRSQ